MLDSVIVILFVFSIRRRHTRCALVTGVQTCALPISVHAYGPVEFFEDADRLLALVTRLTRLHEQGRDKPWAVSDAPEDFIRGQLKGIVGLRLPITRLDRKSVVVGKECVSTCRSRWTQYP